MAKRIGFSGFATQMAASAAVLAVFCGAAFAGMEHMHNGADGQAEMGAHHHGMAGMGGHSGPEGLMIDHSAHEEMLAHQGDGSYQRSETRYEVPDVALRDQSGRPTTLAAALDHDGPVLLNFIFTSCATICPVMSATFGETQEDLSAVEPGYRMISITIDPEYDTPRRLREYAALHHAGKQWLFLTGEASEIRKVIAAFDAIYRAENKMYHLPYTYLRAAPGGSWVRLEGLLSGADLLREYRTVLGHDLSRAD